MSQPGAIYTQTLPQERLSGLPDRGYGALLCTLGYESRSVAIAQVLAAGVQLTAGGFTHGRDDTYAENARVLKDLKATVQSEANVANPRWIHDWITRCRKDGVNRVAIDISSASRPRIAAAVHALRHMPRDVVIDFLYVPEQYVPSAPEPEATEAAGVISQEFAGWAEDARRPLAVFFGLGYEPKRAAGALDFLEPKRAVPFMPLGGDPQFVIDVRAANEEVFRMDHVQSLLDYDIGDPVETIEKLQAIIRRHTGERRPSEERYRALLLPFGPKIFALCCLIVSATSREPLPVWRVTSGRFEQPVNRVAEDRVITLRAGVSPLWPVDD